MPYNVTFTNNNFIDVAWFYETDGFVMSTSPFTCNVPTFFLETFDNNTFINSNDNINPYLSVVITFLANDQPAQYLVTFRNNIFVNYTFEEKNLITLTKPDVANLTVIMENNYFGHVVNSVLSLPMITIMAEYVSVTNLTLNGCDLSTGLLVTGWGGIID